MQDDIWIKKIIEDVTDDCATIAKECMYDMFQTKCEIKDPWGVVNHLEGSFDYIFSLVCRNENFKSNLCIGIPLGNIASFIGYQIDISEAKDAFGEFGNVYCAMLMDNRKLADNFGILRQELPEDAINQAFFPKAWGFNGKLCHDDKWVYLGYTIMEQSIQIDFL